MIITSSVMQQRRSPGALREFVTRLKATVRAEEMERHRGILKKGLYKEFLDEIVPLSLFALQSYPESHEIQSVLGNQGYDALVFDESGTEVDRIEVTIPHDGAAAAKDARLIVNRGYGQFRVGDPGYDFDALFPHVLAACRNKAAKDYQDCTLVVVIEPMLPFEQFEAEYEGQILALAQEMAKIKFRAKRVFLLVMPDRLVAVHG